MINSSSRRNVSLLTCFVAVACILIASSAVAQQVDNGITLDIGSKAPALNIENWINNRDGAFEPVTDFKPGKTYVVEFWATWCGPCLQSMPVLAELQDKYYDDGVQIISVSDQAPEMVSNFLQKPFQRGSEVTFGELTSGYCLTTDPDGSTGRDFMDAAGQTTIPTSFIVGKSGLIEWTGRPWEMDKPLEQIVKGTWDRDAFAEKLKKEQEQKIAILAIKEKLEASLKKADQKLLEGDEKGALEIVNSLVDNKEYAPLRDQLLMIRVDLALNTKIPGAVAALEATIAEFTDNPDALEQLAWSVVETAESGREVKPELLTAAIKAGQIALKANPNDVSYLDTAAHLFQLQGNLDKAIEMQKLAVANAGEQAAQIQPYLDQLKAMKAAQ